MTSPGSPGMLTADPCLLYEDSGGVLALRDLRYTQVHERTVDRAQCRLPPLPGSLVQAAWPRRDDLSRRGKWAPGSSSAD